jgi:hydrogenase maturation protein HypF
MVQGVGFRPYVYRLARSFALTGMVRNDMAGACIEVEGDAARLEAFIDALLRQPPPLASLWSVECEEIELAGSDTFSIITSNAEGVAEAPVLPDSGTCDDCRREIVSPSDRRYGYPFTNCTNCGPRYTILEQLPYDRPNTSMSSFVMCPLCQREYDDPSDRRFHAQPNACGRCGPRLSLVGRTGDALAGDPIEEAARALRQGKVVAVKGLGGFHLAADATDQRAVSLLRERKHRWEKPMAVMAPDLQSVRRFARVDGAAEALLVSPQKPIVLLPKTRPFPLAEGVSPRNAKIGVMLPYTPLHVLLTGEGFLALVLTSGNLSEEPISYRNDEALERLGGIADLFLLHDREIVTRCDDSVVSSTPRGPVVLRRSRGMVPAPLPLPAEALPLLAVGGELKSTVCLARGTQAFMSQHIGDLHGRAAMAFFRETVRKLGGVLRLRPELVVHDLHPDYLSTVWAREESGLPTLSVQHHHAHVLACMAEHGLTEPVVGLAMDGAGYGSDGTTWGAEALLVQGASFQRLGRFRHVALPGGDRAAREPWRMALSYLHLLGHPPLDLLAGMAGGREKVDAIAALLQTSKKLPVASSCGRLFDAVAALLGVRGRNNYEGQAPMELEAAAGDAPCSWSDPPYVADLAEQDGCWIVAQEQLVDGVLEDVRRGRSNAEASRNFHAALANALSCLAVRVCEQTGVRTVALTGGCFHNELLSAAVAELLRRARIMVLEHRNVPAGDGGIALGQALAGALAHP